MSRRLYGEASAAIGATVALDEIARKHARVLRLDTGDRVELFDGEGHLAEAELLEDGRARILRRWSAPSPRPHVTLVWGLPKAPAVDVGVRMATELGVDVIHLALAERSPGAPRPKKLERWRRIAREATRQCERPTTPILADPAPLLEAAAVDAELRLGAFARSEADAPMGALPDAVAIAVGPEGGFTDDEQRHLQEELGYRPLSLGPHVLRAETAVAAALALVKRRSA